MAAGAVSGAERALTIAIRYAWRRRHFSPDGGPERRLIDYRTHQRRLLPAWPLPSPITLRSPT